MEWFLRIRGHLPSIFLNFKKPYIVLIPDSDIHIERRSEICQVPYLIGARRVIRNLPGSDELDGVQDLFFRFLMGRGIVRTRSWW